MTGEPYIAGAVAGDPALGSGEGVVEAGAIVEGAEEGSEAREHLIPES